MKPLIVLTLTALLSMHIVYCQSIIKVHGSEDSLTINQQIQQYLTYLDVREKIHLTVIFTSRMPDKLKGITFCQHSSESTAYQVIKVRIDARLSKKQQALVLAHEMIHVKQYAKGELMVIKEQHVLWQGRKYHYQHNRRHRVPWENEAYQNDHLLSKLSKEQPGAPLTALRIEP